jgi:hypothetical protein
MNNGCILALTALLAPSIQPGMRVDRALPAGPGPAVKCKRHSLTGPNLDSKAEVRCFAAEQQN